MTRINSAVRAACLCDQHLVAEYREMPRVATLAWNAFRSDRGMFIPDEFTFGRGHVGFFCDKGRFMEWRYGQLVSEMRHRGFHVSFPSYKIHPPGWCMPHRPTRDELVLQIQRIVERMPRSPRWTRRTPFDFKQQLDALTQ